MAQLFAVDKRHLFEAYRDGGSEFRVQISCCKKVPSLSLVLETRSALT